MRLRSVGLSLALPMLAALAACGDVTTTTTSTTINVYGPFSECTVILLPNGRVVSFGESGVNVTGSNTINVGGVSYTVDLTNCHAATTTTTTTPK